MMKANDEISIIQRANILSNCPIVPGAKLGGLGA